MKVKNKVIVVTGAGNGIGRELALCLLSKGARVAGVDLNLKSLEETAALTERYKDQFSGFVANVTDRPVVEALPEQVLARFGAIDGIINNAGIIQPFARLNDLDYPVIERVLNVNLYGTLFVTKAFLPHLLQRPEAHIANLSSMGGFLPVPGQTVYCAAKAAVKLLSEGLAAELLDTQVRVTIVFPGAVATNIMSNSGVSGPNMPEANGNPQNGRAPMKALTASKAAEIIVRGIERDAYHVFVGKDATLMDKLHRLSPAFAARTIANQMRSLLPA
jgi:NAD(P)-dependent dehydrogenase (short-subunit alcohol dehydrogenase family)